MSATLLDFDLSTFFWVCDAKWWHFLYTLLFYPFPFYSTPHISLFPLLYHTFLSLLTTCVLLSDYWLSEMPHVELKVVLITEACLSLQSFHQYGRWLTSCHITSSLWLWLPFNLLAIVSLNLTSCLFPCRLEFFYIKYTKKLNVYTELFNKMLAKPDTAI